MGKKIGSKYMASIFADKLSRVNNGFQIKPVDFRKPVQIPEYNNGAKGTFIVQCNKLEISYCETGGSSKGVAQFIKEKLFNFAKANPETEFVVKHSPWKHPQVKGYYNCGSTKEITLANLAPKEIQKKIWLLQSNLGGNEVDYRKKRVISTNPSVRGIWSPFHATAHKI